MTGTCMMVDSASQTMCHPKHTPSAGTFRAILSAHQLTFELVARTCTDSLTSMYANWGRHALKYKPSHNEARCKPPLLCLDSGRLYAQATPLAVLLDGNWT